MTPCQRGEGLTGKRCAKVNEHGNMALKQYYY